MRDFNECKAEVFRRIEEGIRLRRQRRNRVLACCIPLCLCIAVLSVYALPELLPAGKSNDMPENIPVKGDAPVTSDSLADDNFFASANGASGNGTAINDAFDMGTASENFSSLLGTIKANQITGKAAGAKLYFDPALYSEKTLTEQEALDYLGVDFTKLNIGTDTEGLGEKTIITDRSGNIAYDTFSIGYEKGITLLVSKHGLPYDCIYTLDTSQQSLFHTTTDDTAPKVSAMIGTDGAGFYYGDFSVGGLNYRVTAENCSTDAAFAEIVMQIIRLSAQ